MVSIIDTTECHYCGAKDPSGKGFGFRDIGGYPKCSDCSKLPSVRHLLLKRREADIAAHTSADGMYFKSGSDAQEIFVTGAEERTSVEAEMAGRRKRGAEPATVQEPLLSVPTNKLPVVMKAPLTFRTVTTLFKKPKTVRGHGHMTGSEVAELVKTIPWGRVLVKKTIFGNAIMDTPDYTYKNRYQGRPRLMLLHLDEHLPKDWRGLEFHVKHRRINNRHRLAFGVMHRSFNYAAGNDDCAWEAIILWFDPQPGVGDE